MKRAALTAISVAVLFLMAAGLPAQQDKSKIEGTSWSVTFRPSPGNKENEFDDTITFQDDKLLVEKLRTQGFEAGSYKFGVSKTAKTAGFTASMKNQKGETLSFDGAFTGDRIKGKLFWVRGGRKLEFYFFGEKKNVAAAPDRPVVDSTWILTIKKDDVKGGEKAFSEEISFDDDRIKIGRFKGVAYGTAGYALRKEGAETILEATFQKDNNRLAIQGVFKGDRGEGMITDTRGSKAELYTFNAVRATAEARTTLDGTAWSVVFDKRAREPFSGLLEFKNKRLYVRTKKGYVFKPADYTEKVDGLKIVFQATLITEKGEKATIEGTVRERKVEDGFLNLTFGPTRKYPMYGSFEKYPEDY